MIITTFFSKNCENFTSCGMSCGSCMTSSVKWWKARVTAISFPGFSRWSRRKVSNFHESRVGEQCKVATTPEQVPATRAFRRQAKAKRSNMLSNIALEECALPFNRCLLLRRFVFRTEASASSETQGQIVGTRESLNGRKNVARRKAKNGEKSPWDNVLQDQFQKVTVVLASDWCQKTCVFLAPIRSQNCGDRLELVW